MRVCVLALLLLITCAFNVCADMTETANQGYGFWEIGVSNFTADEPIAIRSPLWEDNSYYYIWPLTFKNTISLNRVLQEMQIRLKNAGDNPDQKELLTRCINRIKIDLDRKREPFRLYISLHTDTGKVYQDLSDSVIRDLAQRKLNYHYYTTRELATMDLEPDQIVRVVAIFPEIDPTSDAFEMRILGLGQRMVPSYFPGHLINLENKHEPRLRKSLRYFYKRPGDPLRRESDTIIFDSKKEEWLWMWTTDIYPQQSGQVFVERSQGLSYEFRYFPYEIFNSTPQEQHLKVMEVGLNPGIKWHGIPLSIPMIEEEGNDLVLHKQAVAVLREQEPDLFPQDSSRNVDTILQPGKKVAGVALVRWGVADAEGLLQTVISNLYLNGMATTDANADNPLGQGYVKLLEAERDAEDQYPPLPSKEALTAMVLTQAEKELAEQGVEISIDDERRYEKLAPFAVLINTLALQEIETLEEAGRIPVTFTIMLGEAEDSASITGRFDVPSPEEKDVMVEIKIIDPEFMVIEERQSTPRIEEVTPDEEVGFGDTDETETPEGAKPADTGGFDEGW
ncbi:MAG: hypothetical protein JXA52_08645 [Planctomycetes bacterium]|nr:hypothetical protein [Planctomycetota bacterium]